MIVEFQVVMPFLYMAGRENPRMAIRLRELHCTSGGCKAVVGFAGTDRDSLETALAADGSVGTATHVSTVYDEYVYSLETDDHVLTTVGRGLVGANTVFEGARRAGEHWLFTTRFPDKGTVLAFRDQLLDGGVDIDIDSITEDAEAETYFGLTDPQREVLSLALEHGYFTVPRDASLSDLATELGISSQAASERLRRGTRTLLENTLGETDRTLAEPPPR